jgi:hypothetical protein
VRSYHYRVSRLIIRRAECRQERTDSDRRRPVRHASSRGHCRRSDNRIRAATGRRSRLSDTTPGRTCYGNKDETKKSSIKSKKTVFAKTQFPVRGTRSISRLAPSFSPHVRADPANRCRCYYYYCYDDYARITCRNQNHASNTVRKLYIIVRVQKIRFPNENRGRWCTRFDAFIRGSYLIAGGMCAFTATRFTRAVLRNAQTCVSARDRARV